ncbi:MAG: carbohydrate ABC transporter permease [Anaerolineae bacterium]|nr:carbohydrate ABC transporter permease [Anaerolineae bacterium]
MSMRMQSATMPWQSRRMRRAATSLIAALFMAGVLVFVLMPFYWMLKSSFQTNKEILAMPPIWFPRTFSLEAYEKAMKVIPFTRYIVNSLFTAMATTLISTSLAAMGAYALARYRFPGDTLILVVVMFTQLIPAITRLFPIYFTLKGLGLLNSYQGLIIAYTSFSLPYAALILRGYFQGSYPLELEEAALIDGCGYFSAFLRIVLPISIPGIIAVATFAFLGAWNDFLWSSILLTRGEMKTIQVGIRDFMGEFGAVQRANAFMASCVMTTVPAVILFRIAQKYMVQGISAGAIKG